MCYSVYVKKDMEALSKKYEASWKNEYLDEYKKASLTDVKQFPPLEGRIYPGNYAPVLTRDHGGLSINLMRYGAYPPETIINPNKYTTFNARRDNLGSDFWSVAFMKYHGYVVLEKFYEWVAVKDLLEAGFVKLKEVINEFERQTEERKKKIIDVGKKYKPTPTELKDPMMRQIVIEFRPDNGQDFIAPVIYSYKKQGNDHWSQCGFAIITDEPQPEVLAAGHDRCPIILNQDAVKEWLQFDGKTSSQVDKILSHRQQVTFLHKIAEAA